MVLESPVLIPSIFIKDASGITYVGLEFLNLELNGKGMPPEMYFLSNCVDTL